MKLKLLFSHLGIGLLGLFFAKGIAHSSTPEEAVQKQRSAQTNPTPKAGAQQTKSQNVRRVSRSPRSADFLAAWQDLPDQALSRKDRIATQERLLREWAKVDLAAAIEATLSEAWDGVRDPFSSTNSTQTGVFAEAFAEDPLGSWQLIQSGQFGVGASLLRRTWYASIAETNLLLLSQTLPEIPFSDISIAVEMLTQYSDSEREDFDQISKAVFALPEDLVKTSELLSFLPNREASEISADLHEMKTFDSREATLLIQQLVEKQEIYYHLSDTPERFNALQQQVSELPEGIQGEFLFNLLTDNQSFGFLGGEEAGSTTLKLLDLMIEGEHWEVLNTDDAQKRLQYQTSELPPEDIAAWAVNLPEKGELIELFHRGIDPYIKENIEESWDWIQDFPPGLWRDRALGEYSQQAWRNHKDYEASRRALDAIDNPNFKAIAEQWRPPHIRALDEENEGE